MLEQERILETTKEYIADNFQNTELGLVRIAKNLGLQALSADDLISHCQDIIQSTPIEDVEIRGKNYYFYCKEYSAVLTINRSSLGIITAKRHK
ncbi:MAG: DUF3781 domain-containing protein [Sneathiella sp.]